MRKCTECSIEKPLIDFGNRKHSKDGIRHNCKECNRLNSKRYHKQYAKQIAAKTREDRKKDPAKYQAAELKWYTKNAKKKADYSAQWYRDNADKVRNRLLKKKYGITSEQYEEMLKAQDFKCAICKAPQEQYKSRFAVDHSHVSNKVRGLLCIICNKDVCGQIDRRAKSRFVGMSEIEYVERLYQYYKKSS